MVNQSCDIPTVNESYLKDYGYSVNVIRWFLKSIGAWPKAKTTSGVEKVCTKVLNFLCVFFILFGMIPALMFVYCAEVATQIKLKTIGPLTHMITSGLRYYMMLWKNKEICQCFEHMETDWRMVKRIQDREQMLGRSKVGRILIYTIAVCMHLGVFSYSLMCVSTNIVETIGNETISMHQLPIEFYSNLVDVRYSPANEVVIGMQFCTIFFANSTAVNVCGLAAAFAIHACGQLNVVMSWFDDLLTVNGGKNEFVENQLATIVQHHLRTLSFISSIENIMHPICLFELVGCVVNLCMLGYYCITEWHQEGSSVTTYIIIFISTIYNTFIFCYIGEILTEQCKEVGKKAYMTEWYELPHKTSLNLVLVILRSSIEVKITAGKIVQLSIATFGDVIKTSFTYLNMLRTVTL